MKTIRVILEGHDRVKGVRCGGRHEGRDDIYRRDGWYSCITCGERFLARDLAFMQRQKPPVGLKGVTRLLRH